MNNKTETIGLLIFFTLACVYIVACLLQTIENLPRLEANQMIFDATADFAYEGFVSIVCDEVPTERETVAQQKARIARERRAAKRLADALLEDLEIPEDIQAEMDAEFGAEF